MRTFLAMLTLALMASPVAAQEASPQSDQQSSQQASAPAFPVSGSPRDDAPPEVPSVERMPSNTLQFGFRATGAYDDNGGSFVDSKGGFITGFAPVVRLNSNSERYTSMFEYQPSYTRTTGLFKRDDYGQSLNAKLGVRLSKRMILRLQNSFNITSSPFEARNGLPDPVSPNGTVATAFVRRKSEIASADLEYMLSGRTSVGVAGNFASQRYNDPSGVGSQNQNLLNSTNSSGRVYVRHSITKRIAAGLEYDYQDLFVGNSKSRTQTHSAVAFMNFALSRHQMVSVFAGPERSHLRDIVVLDLGLAVITFPVNQWMTSTTAGGSYTLEGKTSLFRAEYNRKIADGGGLLGPVRLQAVSANYNRQFTRRWSADLGFGYGHNQALGPISNLYESYTGDVGVHRQLSRNLNLSMEYQHVQQNYNNSNLLLNDHNRVAVTLEYLWTRPLGR